MNVPAEVIHALGGNPPTEQQWEAICHPLSPCAVIAGAGSGKTAVMAARVVYLALARSGRIADVAPESGANPSDVLCLTFTNKAAAELARRVAAAVTPLGLDEGEEATVLTYHAFAATMLDEYGMRMGIEHGQMLLSAAQRWQIAAALFTDRTFEHLEVRSMYPVSQMLELADQCANHLVDPARLAADSRAFADREEIRTEKERITYLRRAELADLVVAYRDRKREIGAIDYGDQISLAVQLARTQPVVVADVRSRYPAVLLDEFQDTNSAQGALLAALLGTGYSVTCVGDPDQNIYAWRGASLQNILEFNHDFGGQTLPLYVNFRSGSRILDVANAVISAVPDERRAPGKRLEPDPSRGEGLVESFVAADEHAEATQIAQMITDAAAAGTSLREIAILCRKKRLMEPIRRALTDAGIPVEVADLGGLLSVPEVVDVVAWLRVLDDPARNVALTRILQGPRWRIGYRDIVALARWSSRNNRVLREELSLDEHPGDVAFPLAESLDHLDDDDMTGLSGEARDRLRELNALIVKLRRACTGPLDELVTTIAEETGLMAELEWRTSAASVSARRNLLNFTAAVAGFAPVEGAATLGTLVSFLDAAQEAEAEDFEQAQLSDSETVKLLTIHKAKGLEWDVVFVPGLATSSRSKIFPDVTRQPNPVESPKALPFELRSDAAILPAYGGNLRAFKEALKERALEEERRLCYVALTRARKHLIVSSAHWYEGPREPHEPGIFYNEISAHASCTEIARAECPQESPLIARRLARVPEWPLPRVNDAAYASLAALIEELGLPRDAQRRVTGLPAPALPDMLSVSAVATFDRCPRAFYDAYVRPLPQRPSPAARLGTEIHRWIELRNEGRDAPPEADPDPERDADRPQGAPGITAGLQAAFEASSLAAIPPLHVERPFVLIKDGRIVGGRIDVIYLDDDGGWHIVDYKTGSGEERPEWSRQLGLYAEACRRIWNPPSIRASVLQLTGAGPNEIPVKPDERPITPDIDLRERPACSCNTCE